MKCNLCPRACNVDRNTDHGFCHSGQNATVARVAPHYWEEPPLSANCGSGTIFFGGCNLRCRFCQNYTISASGNGVEVTDQQLAKLLLYVNDMGVNNINLVTPQHFLPNIRSALSAVKSRLHIPVVYNTNAYERVEQLATLQGLVDIYLPDLKFCSSQLSYNMCGASDYFEVATAAISEMKRQQPNDVFDNGIMKRGVIVRHLVLPQCVEDTKLVLDWIAKYYPQCYVSLMAQYFVTHTDDKYPFLNRKLTKREYEAVTEYFFNVGLINGFSQDADSATEDYVPDFDTNAVRDIVQQADKIYQL